MTRDPEDEDHTTFFRLEGSHTAEGGEPVVSRAAIQLHGHAIVNSAQDGRPGFVPYEYLNAISAETTIAAAELCTAYSPRLGGGVPSLAGDRLIESAEAVPTVRCASGGLEILVRDWRSLNREPSGM